MPSDDTGTTEKHASQPRKTESKKSAHNQQDSSHGKENDSSDMQIKSLEKAKSMSETTEASTDSKTKVKPSDTNDVKNGNTIWKENGKTSDTLEATNPHLENSSVSVEEKTMHDLEEARLALNRLKNIIKTVTHVNSASPTEDKELQTEEDAKTISNKQSSVKSSSKVLEKKSEVIKKGSAGPKGRRGESGLKMLKRGATVNARSKEDSTRTVIVDDAKLAKQKGESTLMSKNGPGAAKFDKFASKNTRREISTAELLLEQPKGSLSSGPKHTPPLKEKVALIQARNCENLGRKKRKGEAFPAECLTPDHSKQAQSSNTDVAIEQVLTTTEFSKAAINEKSTTKSDTPPLDSDGEAVLMKQTSADEISATTSSDSSASERTSEAKVLKKSDNKTAIADDAVKSKTRDSEGEDIKGASGASTKDDNNLEVKTAKDVSMKSKTSDREIEIGKATSGNENPDAKVLEKSQRKTSVAEDVTESKVSDREIEIEKQLDQETINGNENPAAKGLEKRQRKTSAAKDVAKIKVSDKEVDNDKKLGGATTNVVNKNPVNSSEVRAPSNINQELPTADYKPTKELKAKKASLSIKEQVKNAEFLHSAGAGSSVFETSFMNVQTDGSLQELSEDECRHIEGVQALVVRNKQFSAWLSLDTKNIE